MKKNFYIPLLISLILGFVSAQIVYSYYRKNLTDSEYNSYVIQGGVYVSEETLKEAVSKLDSYLIVNENDKYYVYLGITMNLDNANKIKAIYDAQEVDIYVKKVQIDNLEFVSNLQQYDVLIEGLEDNKSVLSVNEAVLATYEEMVLGKS